MEDIKDGETYHFFRYEMYGFSHTLIKHLNLKSKEDVFNIWMDLIRQMEEVGPLKLFIFDLYFKNMYSTIMQE